MLFFVQFVHFSFWIFPPDTGCLQRKGLCSWFFYSVTFKILNLKLFSYFVSNSLIDSLWPVQFSLSLFLSSSIWTVDPVINFIIASGLPLQSKKSLSAMLIDSNAARYCSQEMTRSRSGSKSIWLLFENSAVLAIDLFSNFYGLTFFKVAKVLAPVSFKFLDICVIHVHWIITNIFFLEISFLLKLFQGTHLYIDTISTNFITNFFYVVVFLIYTRVNVADF